MQHRNVYASWSNDSAGDAALSDLDDYFSDEEQICGVCGDELCPGCGPSVQGRLWRLALIPLGLVATSFVVRSVVFDGEQEDSDDRSPARTLPISNSSSLPVPAATTSVTPTQPSTTALADRPNWDLLARSVVFIEALSPCDWRGSGTIVLDGSYVLTNEHVASSGECPLRVGLTTSLSATPSGSYEAQVLVTDKALDLAVLRLVDASGSPLKVEGHDAVAIDYVQPPLGSRLATLGYPALGSYNAGMTITFTSGTFSGIDYTDGEFFKTDAQMRGGVSGGAAFNERGMLIGIPTGGLIEEDTGEAVGINLIRPVKFAQPLLERAQSQGSGGSASQVPAPGVGTEVGGSSDGQGGDSGTDPRFGTCKEAIANGYGPYYYGVDPEYDWYIDRDGDGIVCER